MESLGYAMQPDLVGRYHLIEFATPLSDQPIVVSRSKLVFSSLLYFPRGSNTCHSVVIKAIRPVIAYPQSSVREPARCCKCHCHLRPPSQQPSPATDILKSRFSSSSSAFVWRCICLSLAVSHVQTKLVLFAVSIPPIQRHSAGLEPWTGRQLT